MFDIGIVLGHLSDTPTGPDQPLHLKPHMLGVGVPIGEYTRYQFINVYLCISIHFIQWNCTSKKPFGLVFGDMTTNHGDNQRIT